MLIVFVSEFVAVVPEAKAQQTLYIYSYNAN
jgi:hypothetical protein